MLAPCDRILVPPGVRRAPGLLVDDVRGCSFAVNATAEAVLDRAGDQLERAAHELGRRWALDEAAARRDVLVFAWELNRHGLVNVARGGARSGRVLTWLRVAVRSLPSGRLPAGTVERRPLDTSTAGRAVVSTARALADRVAALALVATLGLVLADIVAGGSTTGASWALGPVLGAGVLLHEAGHAVALRGVPAALLLLRGRVSVLHPPLSGHRVASVALAGPGLPALVGVVLALVALRTGSTLAALTACPPAGHLLSATVAGRDGRLALRLVGVGREQRSSAP
jgi:hypothetical protein